MGLFNSISGLDGKIEIVGLGLVIGMIQKWTLERRVETGSDEATWNLRAFLAYQNDAWINKTTSKRRLTLTLDAKTTFLAEPIEGATWQIEGNSLLVEGVRVWQKK
jgi:hypothetical protein